MKSNKPDISNFRKSSRASKLTKKSTIIDWGTLGLPDLQDHRWIPQKLPIRKGEPNLRKFVSNISKEAFDDLNLEAFLAAQEVLKIMLIIRKLWAAFQEDRKIDGPKGVAEILEVSRSRVYQLLNECGLDQEKLSDPAMSEYGLLLQSGRFNDALLKLRKLTSSQSFSL